MLKRETLVVIVVAIGIVSGAVAFDGGEVDVAFEDLPPEVVAAVRNAVPRIEFVAAEMERTRRGVVYEIEGIADGARYEVEVTETGEVLGVELETDDEDSSDSESSSDDSSDSDESESSSEDGSSESRSSDSGKSGWDADDSDSSSDDS